VALFELIFRQSGKPLEQKGLDLIGRPERVYDFLVRKNRVCGRRVAAHQNDEKKCSPTNSKQAPTPGEGACRC
jgi:hypothetical protein